MDSREFEVLTDVISNVGLAQVCHQHRTVIEELAAVARQHSSKNLTSHSVAVQDVASD